MMTEVMRALSFLSSSQFRKLEVFSRILMSCMVIVFVFVALGTYDKVEGVETQIERGNCSYLLENDIVTDERYEELYDNSEDKLDQGFNLSGDFRGTGE